MADQPYWNPSDKDSGCTLSNSDRTASQAAFNTGAVRSTTYQTAGKFYVEIVITSNIGFRSGVANSTYNVANSVGGDANAWVVRGNEGDKINNNTATSYGSGFALNDVLMIAVDVGAGKIWWGKNGSWFASGDPGAGTGEGFSGLSASLALLYGANSGAGIKVGTLTEIASYAYSAPSGFTAGWGAGATTFNQSLSATLTGTASIRKSVQKRLSATLTATATIRKTVQKRLSAALPMAATLAWIALRPVALVASITLTATMRREIAKFLSGSVTLTGTIVKTVHKALSAACTLTGSIAKAFPVHLVASLTATASMTRTIYKFLSGSLPMTGVLGKIKAVVVNMSASLGMTATLRASTLFIRSLSASITLTASIRRTISKMLSAPLPVIARPIAWVASMFAATRHDKPNWNQCARCWRKQRPNKMQQQMEYRGPRLVWTGLYVCHTCLDDPQPQEIWPRETGGDPKPVILARPRRD